MGMSEIILPDQDDLVTELPDLNVTGEPATADAAPQQQPRDEGLPNVDAEAAAEAAEEQANAFRAAANPHEFVTMDHILKSEAFAGLIVSIPMALGLLIALIVESPHSCDAAEGYQARYTRDSVDSSMSQEDYGDPPPIKAWGITCCVINSLLILVDGLATRMYIKNPAIPFVPIIIRLMCCCVHAFCYCCCCVSSWTEQVEMHAGEF